MFKFYLCMLILPLQMKAEYRAYQYLVRGVKIQPDQKSSLSNIVISTLDPVSYVSYHGGNRSTSVKLLNSWVCPGNTAKEKTCQPPHFKLGQND